jgi:hypothetical protein
MKYNPPLGGAPGDPYIDGNPGAGTEGSTVPAAAIEFPQREIVNVITAAALAPDNADETQLLQAIRAIIAAGGGVGGQCYLQYVDATHIALVPDGGANVPIAGVNHALPAPGVTITNAGLANSTRYNVYGFINAGAVALELSATGHATDATAGNVGVEIKAGDNSRSLVGMIKTDGAGHFQPQGIGTLSWFNLRAIPLVKTASTVAFSNSGALAKISTAYDVAIVTWADEGIWGVCDGVWKNDTPAGTNVIQLAVDDVLVGSASGGYAAAANLDFPFSSSFAGLLAEGSHTVSMYGTNTPGETSTIDQGYTRVMVRG